MSALPDKKRPPTEADVATALGPAFRLWTRFVREMQDVHGPLTEQWNHAGPKLGWSLRLREQRRVLAYCTPCERHFVVGVVLGDNAIAAARESGLPRGVLAAIEEAPRNAEGRGLRMPVRAAADVEHVLELVSFKVQTAPASGRPRRGGD